ncbi:hypothetical protein FQR65_LT05912 [Abscondita terminalis]|nr:hypothetical protein FQR65_LT05912 [Abscondita terminalis]
MISSATQLLMNDIRQTVSNSYLDDSRMSLNKINQKPSAVLATRFNCMQAWFLRCSRLTKLQFLTEMMNSLKTLSSLSIILNTLKTCSGKSTIYSLANNSNFSYDKGLNDHNRSLDGFTLKEVQENDLKWFRSLQDSSEQVLILLGLIRLGGGLIMYEIYKRGVKLFEDLASRAPVDENKNVEEEANRKPKSK